MLPNGDAVTSLSPRMPDGYPLGLGAGQGPPLAGNLLASAARAGARRGGGRIVWWAEEFDCQGVRQP